VERIQEVVVKDPSPSDFASLNPSVDEELEEQQQPLLSLSNPSLIAGYTPEEIAEQAERCKDNAWVKANDSPKAQRDSS
jgi:hypothetical protein